MESIHIKAKNWSNVFVDTDTDENDKVEVRLSIHIIGASCSTRLSMKGAQELIEALQQAIKEAA